MLVFLDKIDGSISITAQYKKQAVVHAKLRINVCLKYFQLNSIIKLPECCTYNYLFYLFIIQSSQDSETGGTLFNAITISSTSREACRSPLAHKYRKLSRPFCKISQMAQKLGKHNTNNNILQWLLIKSTHPARHANRQPSDQYTLDMLNIRARWLPGTTYVIYVAVSGSAMPMPIPQKKRTTTKKVNEVHRHESRPNIDVMMASASKNLYLPYLSEYVSRQDPKETPKYTMVISNDLSNLSRFHQLPSLGMSKPNTIVQHPQENSSIYRDLMSFSCPGPNPIRCSNSSSMLS